MAVIEVVTQGGNESGGIVNVGGPGKTTGFASFATSTSAVSEIEAFDGTGIGQMLPQAVEPGWEFGFAENRVNVNFDHPLTTPMFDNLSIDQRLGNADDGEWRLSTVSRAGGWIGCSKHLPNRFPYAASPSVKMAGGVRPGCNR